MKAQYVERNIDVQGGGMVIDYQVAQSGKLFNILTDSLYTDQIGAIVRELSTNAIDAHIAAGREEIPFEIHVPDQLEPHFSVTDTGIGMSPEKARNVFCVMGLSDKDESNEMAGMFGLGSKTPFAYCDSFTVYINYEGERTIYRAYKDTRGHPVLQELATQPTDDRNGVCIDVPVLQSDVSRFRDAILSQLRHFDPKPVLKNSGGMRFEEADENRQRYGNMTCRDPDKVDYYKKRITIIQGQVGYRFNVSDFITALHDGMVKSAEVSSDEIDQLSNFLQMLERMDTCLYYDIGQIEVPPSRETILLREHTVTSIYNSLTIIREEMIDQLREKYSKLDRVCDIVSSWNGNNVDRNLAMSLGLSASDVIDIPEDDSDWVRLRESQGFMVLHPHSYEGGLGLIEKKVRREVKGQDGTDEVIESTFNVRTQYVRQFRFVKSSNRMSQVGKFASATSSPAVNYRGEDAVDKCLFVVRDQCTASSARIRHTLIEKQLTTAYTVDFADEHGVSRHPTELEIEKAMSEWSEAFGGVEFVRCSKLDRPAKKRRGDDGREYVVTPQARSTAVSLRTLRSLDLYEASSKIYDDLNAIEEGVLYFVYHNRSVQNPLTLYQQQLLRVLLNGRCDGTIDGMRIIGINMNRAKTLPHKDNWHSLQEYLQDRLEGALHGNRLRNHYVVRQLLEKLAGADNEATLYGIVDVMNANPFDTNRYELKRAGRWVGKARDRYSRMESSYGPEIGVIARHIPVEYLGRLPPEDFAQRFVSDSIEARVLNIWRAACDHPVLAKYDDRISDGLRERSILDFIYSGMPSAFAVSSIDATEGDFDQNAERNIHKVEFGGQLLIDTGLVKVVGSTETD